MSCQLLVRVPRVLESKWLPKSLNRQNSRQGLQDGVCLVMSLWLMNQGLCGHEPEGSIDRIIRMALAFPQAVVRLHHAGLYRTIAGTATFELAFSLV